MLAGADVNLTDANGHSVVELNLSSALILEDDSDWDLRIKSQMQEFAAASRILLQPLRGTSDRFMDPTHLTTKSTDEPASYHLGHESQVAEPVSSPYGDIAGWDLLWLGHCGARFPIPAEEAAPLGRVEITDDPTVPETQHLDPQFGGREYIDQYPAHTRIVSHVRGNYCTLGYAVSQQGARKILYEMAIHAFTGPTDLMLHQVCGDTDGRIRLTCLSVQPQLFQHHRPLGDKSAFSDISNVWSGQNKLAFTRNVRWSTHLNFGKLLAGKTDYVDLFKDGQEAIDLGA